MNKIAYFIEIAFGKAGGEDGAKALTIADVQAVIPEILGDPTRRTFMQYILGHHLESGETFYAKTIKATRDAAKAARPIYANEALELSQRRAAAQIIEKSRRFIDLSLDIEDEKAAEICDSLHAGLAIEELSKEPTVINISGKKYFATSYLQCAIHAVIVLAYICHTAPKRLADVFTDIDPNDRDEIVNAIVALRNDIITQEGVKDEVQQCADDLYETFGLIDAPPKTKHPRKKVTKPDLSGIHDCHIYTEPDAVNAKATDEQKHIIRTQKKHVELLCAELQKVTLPKSEDDSAVIAGVLAETLSSYGFQYSEGQALVMLETIKDGKRIDYADILLISDALKVLKPDLLPSFNPRALFFALICEEAKDGGIELHTEELARLSKALGIDEAYAKKHFNFGYEEVNQPLKFHAKTRLSKVEEHVTFGKVLKLLVDNVDKGFFSKLTARLDEMFSNKCITPRISALDQLMEQCGLCNEI